MTAPTLNDLATKVHHQHAQWWKDLTTQNDKLTDSRP